MTFSKLKWRALGVTAAAALTIGVAPAAGAAIITADDATCTLTANSAERPFIAANLPDTQAAPVLDGVFQHEITAADVPAMKARVSRDEFDVRSTHLHFLLSQCMKGRPGAASLEPNQPGSSVPEARVGTVALSTTVTLGSVIFGSLPTLIDVLR